MNYHAIIILGGGTKDRDTLSLHSEARLNRGIQLFHEGESEKLIFSGGNSFWHDLSESRVTTDNQLLTEASMMKEKALKLGIPETAIIVEKDSKDSIGNAIFTKRIAIGNQFNNLLIITSQVSAERVRYIFQKVYGGEFSLSFDVVNPTPVTSEQAEREKAVLAFTKKYLDQISDGDHEKIWGILQSFHPGYGGSGVDVSEFRRFE